MPKVEFVQKYQAVRAAFLDSLAGLAEAEAAATSGPTGEWPSIKDMIGHIAAWEREVLIADEMIKRGEESHLDNLDKTQFNHQQAEHRRSWTLEQVRSELDLNYEALLMAWDEYEGQEGPFGPATWEPGQPGTLWDLIYHQAEHGRDIAHRRGLKISFPV